MPPKFWLKLIPIAAALISKLIDAIFRAHKPKD